MNILVIGESCIDSFIYGIANRLCPEAPVPVFTKKSIISNSGMASNVANNIRDLDAGLVVDVWTNENWENITKSRFVDDRTNHMFLRVDNNDDTIENIELKSEDLEELSKYDAIIISDYDKGFLTEDDIAKIADSHHLVLLDSKKQLGEWCKGVTYIKINGFEYERSKDRICDSIAEKLIVTLGNRGCQYNNKVYEVSNVPVRDVSGAGDTFMAALTAALLEGRDIDTALRYANICATKVVQKRGVSTLRS